MNQQKPLQQRPGTSAPRVVRRARAVRRACALLPLVLFCGCSALQPIQVSDSAPVAGGAQEPAAAAPSELASAAPTELASEPAPEEAGWNFLVKPYLFACGLEGTVSTGTGPLDVGAEFDDLFDSLDIGGMLAFEARPPDSSWTILADAIYIRLKDKGVTPGPAGLAVDGTLEETVIELSAAYELVDRGRLEVLAGVRYCSVNADLVAHLPGGPRASSTNTDWVDPLVGLRSRLALAREVDLLLRGDLGGFGVGSDLAGNLAVELDWSISSAVQVALGYRYLYLDYDDDSTFDLSQAGPMLGLGLRF